MFRYRNHKGRTYSLDEAMRFSEAFIVICTKNFLEDLLSGNERLMAEFRSAKKYGTPTILLLIENLTKEQVKQAKQLFKGHSIIKVFENVPLNLKEWKEYDEFKRLLFNLKMHSLNRERKP